ncbi:MAG: hypothetical protein IPK82_42910 [Polyangiaceae bacterium]|nr:hypothetical protein [Polyangiaceae bacterium]
MNNVVKVLGSVVLASAFAVGCGVSGEKEEFGAPEKKVMSTPSGGIGGGSAASVGGATAGVGGATAGVGGATAGVGGAMAGVGGATAGVGSTTAGVGGAVAGVGGLAAGSGGGMVGVGGFAAGVGGGMVGVGGMVGAGGDSEASTASGAGGATSGAGGATSGAGGAGQPPARVQVPCGGMKVVKQGDKRTLYASAQGATEAQAKAKCEAEPWWAGVSGFECTVAASCPTTPYPHCNMYFGPDTFVTKECTCKNLIDRWDCFKEGEIPVGSAVECFSCYQTTLKVPCGQKVKLPATMSSVAVAYGYSDVSEQKAKEECEKAEWDVPGIWCERPANDTTNGPTPRPKYTLQNESQCSCEKFLVSPDRWKCKRTAVMVNDSDIDCTACAPQNQ